MRSNISVSEDIHAKASEDVAVDSEFRVDLTEDEKLVLYLLQENSPIDLNELKGMTGLSNKKWDTAIKGLRAKELANVEKTDDPPSLTIHLL